MIAPRLLPGFPRSTPSTSPPSVPSVPSSITLQAVESRSLLRPRRPGSAHWPCAEADFTINPYRGCQFGCAYCHARSLSTPFGPAPETPSPRGNGRSMEAISRDFERRITFKSNAAALLARELGRLGERLPAGGSPPTVAIGTVTDPYQPVEETLRVTRSILEALHAGPRLEVVLNTKSDLILRDLDLLRALAGQSALRVNLTITTLDHDLARGLEPGAPSPRRRLAALRALTGAGLSAGVLLMPLIPGVNDGEREIDALAREVRSAGAGYLLEAPLILPAAAAEPFFRFLRRSYPQLERAYREAFDEDPRTPERYREKVRRRVARARRAHGLSDRPPRTRPASSRPASPRQLEIPLET